MAECTGHVIGRREKTMRRRAKDESLLVLWLERIVCELCCARTCVGRGLWELRVGSLGFAVSERRSRRRLGSAGGLSNRALRTDLLFQLRETSKLLHSESEHFSLERRRLHAPCTPRVRRRQRRLVARPSPRPRRGCARRRTRAPPRGLAAQARLLLAASAPLILIRSIFARSSPASRRFDSRWQQQR